MKFDPTDWSNISKEAIDMIERMLDKDNKTRITSSECLKHPWMQLGKHIDTPLAVKEKIVEKLRDFRAPKTL